MTVGAVPPPIEAPLEIRQILEQLRRHRSMLSIATTAGLRPIGHGRLEAIAPGFVWLRLEGSPDSASFHEGTRFAVSTCADGVTIQFELALRHAGAESEGIVTRLSCALPTRLLRIQRREAYRIRDDAGLPLGDLVRRVDGGERTHPLLDLSGDGLAIVLPSRDTPDIGTLWRHCRLEFPDLPPVPCDLRVRALAPESSGAGETDQAWSRVGCVFERPSTEAQRRIEAYVIAVQRHARARREGLARTATTEPQPYPATPACS